MAAANLRGDRTPGGGNDRGGGGDRSPGGNRTPPMGPREMEFHDTGPFAETTDLYHFLFCQIQNCAGITNCCNAKVPSSASVPKSVLLTIQKRQDPRGVP
jgi:hypothetical protein